MQYKSYEQIGVSITIVSIFRHSFIHNLFIETHPLHIQVQQLFKSCIAYCKNVKFKN